jgi:hypothetical protein
MPSLKVTVLRGTLMRWAAASVRAARVPIEGVAHGIARISDGGPRGALLSLSLAAVVAVVALHTVASGSVASGKSLGGERGPHRRPTTVVPDSAAVPAAAVPPTPTVHIPWKTYVLVESPERAEAIRSHLEHEEANRRAAQEPPLRYEVVVVESDERADRFRRNLAEAENIRAGLGLPLSEVVDLRPAVPCLPEPNHSC